MKAVEELYRYRDHYFEEHSIDEAAQKNADVKTKLDETMSLLDGTISDDLKVKAEYLMLRGKALNVLPSFDREAQEHLEKAVKLDPKLSDAWVCLGESYWKNHEVEAARNCFVGALNHGKEKVALRNLSMVIRHLGKDAEERAQNIEESILKAKESVQLDITDGISWFILGNAYLSQFFAGNQSSTVLKRCLSAYQHAEKDLVAACNPDLHHNRATIYQFQEEYQLALVGFSRAAALDPMFAEPIVKRRFIMQHLVKCAELIQTTGSIRNKKLKSMISGINESTDLGSYSNGSYTGKNGKTIALTPVLFNQLVNGCNAGKVVLGKVVCSLSSEGLVAFTFCVVDKQSTCLRVTVYNIASGWGVKIGDVIAIPEPFLHHVDVALPQQHIDFKSIRVESPVVLVVNGHKLSDDTQAPSMLIIKTQSE